MRRLVEKWVLLGWFLLQSPFLFGGEWDRFRGPDGTGQAEASSIPSSWTETDYLWSVELPGIGHSSPVSSGGRVFVSSALQADGTRIVLCLDAETGNPLWEKRILSNTFESGRSTSYDTASPAIDDQRVYVACVSAQSYLVVALDRDNGEEVWRKDLGPFEGQHGFGSSPVVFDDLLILANDQIGPSSTIALDSETGELRWRQDRRSGKAAYSTPMVYRPKSGDPQLLVASTAQGISSLDPRSGQVKWELPGVFQDLRIVGSPVVAGDVVFAQCGAGGGGKRMVAISPAGVSSETARVLYEVTGSLPYVPIPVAYEKWIFMVSDSGIASCVEVLTGDRVWKERIGGSYFASPVRIGDRIFCVSREGEVVVLAASPEFRILGRTNLGEESYSTPAVADGTLFLRTFSHLLAVGGR